MNDLATPPSIDGSWASPVSAIEQNHAQAEPTALAVPDLLAWLGDGKLFIASLTIVASALALAYALAVAPTFTARTSLLPPGSQQQGGSAAALAALGSLGGLASGLGSKTPDELYALLLRSDSVLRGLDEQFALKARYGVKTNEELRVKFPKFVRVTADKKSGVINVEVDDEEAQFAAALANAHVTEVTKVLGRLAVSEAQQRRVFFERQLRESKENLVKAESDLRAVQEKSGVIVLDRQAEALISGAAQVRSLIADREVRLRVLRTGATERNADVIRLSSELSGLRSELSRMESSEGGTPGSSVNIPVGKIPGAAIDFVRARRELKLQETLLEAMVRQYEAAKLDEAKEGPLLQQIDKAMPPDRKSKPARAVIVLSTAGATFLLASFWVLVRRYWAWAAERDPLHANAWRRVKRSWQLGTKTVDPTSAG